MMEAETDRKGLNRKSRANQKNVNQDKKDNLAGIDPRPKVVYGLRRNKIIKALSLKREKERREGHMKDALALGGEEGRDKLRKAALRGKYPLKRGCPNGATRRSEPPPPGIARGQPGELKHLSTRRKRKQQ